MSKKRPRIKDLVVEILANRSTTMSILELHKEIVKHGYAVTYQAVFKAVRELEREGRLKVRKAGGSVQCKLAYTPLDKWVRIEVRGIIEERAREQGLAEKGIIYDFIDNIVSIWEQYYELSKGQIDNYFRKAAELLIHENPHNLLCRLAEWLYKKHLEAVREYVRERGQGPLARREILDDLERKMRWYERFAERVFNRGLGIPADLERDELGSKEYEEAKRTLAGLSVDIVPTKGPFCFRYYPRRNEYHVGVKLDIVSRLLKRAVIGETFIEVRRLEKPKHPCLHISTDASRFVLKPPPLFEEIAPHLIPPAAYIQTISACVDILRDWEDYDYYPKPSSPSGIPRDYFVDPREVLVESDRLLRERLVLAAQEGALYDRDEEALREGWTKPVTSTSDQGWALSRRAYIVFRDGRIFPLEHLYSDFRRRTPHGERVRRAATRFLEILNTYAKDARYWGIVKSPSIEIIAPIVFWYLKYGPENGPIWADLPDENIFASKLLSDQIVVLKLFRALKDRLAPDEVLLTCRFVRPLFSLNEDWVAFRWFKNADELRQFLSERYEAALLGEVDEEAEAIIDLFADLAMRAAVMHLYVSIPQSVLEISEVRIPRYEVLLDPNVMGDAWNNAEEVERRAKALHRFDEKAIERLLTALSDKRALDVYPENELSEFERGKGDLVTPKATVLAHLNAKDTAKILGEELAVRVFERLVSRWRT